MNNRESIKDLGVSDVYSVWLVPKQSEEEYHKLDGTIRKYAQLYEDASEFEPHITIVGGLEGNKSIFEKGLQTLAKRHDPFEIQFTMVQCSTTRHQCIFLLVEPTAELFSLHQKVVEMYELGEQMYVPHLSLIYSDMSIEERLKIVDSIDITALPSTVQISQIALVKTTGSVPEWETIDKYNL